MYPINYLIFMLFIDIIELFWMIPAYIYPIRSPPAIEANARYIGLPYRARWGFLSPLVGVKLN